jgi:preprotein translocase subunit SecG
MLTTVLTVVHILLTVSLIGLVLIQRGKGADIGAAFGSGASNTMFGSQGSASFLTRTTAVVATLFFVTSMSLTYMASQHIERKSVTEVEQVTAPAAAPESAPAAPASGGATSGAPAAPSDKPDVPVPGE